VVEQPVGFRRASPAKSRLVTDAMHAVPCPFAALLTIEVWQRGKGSLLPLTLQDAQMGKAIVIEIQSIASSSLETLRNAVQETLTDLGTNAQQMVEPDAWWFNAGRGSDVTQWFCTVHSCLYPVEHSRHWPLDAPVIALVPASVFRRLMPQGASSTTRSDIRAAFESKGQRYAKQGGAIAGLST
jgi:hypothetical protein